MMFCTTRSSSSLPSSSHRTHLSCGQPVAPSPMALRAAPAIVLLPSTTPPGGAAVVPRRMQGKQPPPPHQSRVLASAMAAECADDGLQTLGQTVKRKHVHWTHARTFNSSQRQPSSFTRKQFWEHMAQCYRLAYPTVGSPTGGHPHVWECRERAARAGMGARTP